MKQFFFVTIKNFLLIFMIILTNSVLSISKLNESKNLSVSVNIPCHHKHFIYLDSLLQDIATNQTCLPEEVIVSLSGTRYLDAFLIKNIEDKVWPFKLKIIQFTDSKKEAFNRNKACQMSTKDLIIGQDCDDIMHPQRIEIIKYFFEHYDIVHLLHSYDITHFLRTISDGNFQLYADIDKMPFTYCDSPEKAFSLGVPIANGPSSFLRRVFNEIQWDESIGAGVDVDFNRRIYEKFKKKNLILLVSIYWYKIDLSSYIRRVFNEIQLNESIEAGVDVDFHRRVYEKFRNKNLILLVGIY